MTRIFITATVLAMMAASPLSAEIYLSHTSFLDVQSSSDGNGNFTYSFTGSSDNPDFGLYFIDGSGTITIPAVGVEAVSAPPDWQGLVTGDGLVTFQYTGSGGVWIQNTPIVFSLSSSVLATMIYDSVGEASAPFTQFGNPNNGGWGTQPFSYIGPAPEPSATAVFMSGTVVLACATWRSSRVAKSDTSLPVLHGQTAKGGEPMASLASFEKLSQSGACKLSGRDSVLWTSGRLNLRSKPSTGD